jgi:hypothetical protein
MKSEIISTNFSTAFVEICQSEIERNLMAA